MSPDLAARTRSPAGDDTRAALIASATAIFIEEGFRAARVQDVAKQAGVRLSAINYHFGGKSGLYRAVLQHHANQIVSRAPLPPPDTANPRKSFEVAVRTLVRRFIDPDGDSQLAALMIRELVNPTEALTMMIDHFSRPQIQLMHALIAGVLGPRASDEQIARAILSLFGQCLAYVTARPLITQVMPAVLAGEEIVERITQHVTTFSWGGLMALRDELERSS